jgi:gliding motility-associated-like protein
MRKVVKLGLLIVCLAAFGQISGQTADCQFNVEVSVAKISDCESNGIIKAVLSGDNVTNAIIDSADARYSIQSVTPGGYSKIFDANHGIIQGVPPGTYIIIADAFCTSTNSRVNYSSAQITMTGTYPGFKQESMEINTAGIKRSLKCSPTGVIPVEVGSGRPPYSVRVIEAPDANWIDSVFTFTEAGIYNIENVRWGDYTFTFSDACGYTVYRSPRVDAIEPEYKITGSEDTPACLQNGKISFSLKNGTLPYMIVITEFPEEYTGEDTLIVEHDGNLTIDRLPAGIYDFTISDVCQPREFTVTINEGKFTARSSQSKSSVPCKEEGEITFHLSGGLPPYTIKPLSCPDNRCPLYDSLVVSTVNDTVIKGLLPGIYSFLLLDQCRKDSLRHEITIDTLKLGVLASDIQAVSSCYDADGRATIKVTGGAKPYVATMFDRMTNTFIALPSTDPPYNFTGLGAGDYKFEITDDCGRIDSASFSMKRDSLRAELTAKTFMSVDCGASAAIGVKITDGKPDYILIISQNGNSIDTLGPSNAAEFQFENYPPGEFEIKVKDACNDSVMLKTEILSFDFGDPDMKDEVTGITAADLYEDMFFPLNPADADCRKVIIKKKNKRNTSFYQLWSDHPEMFEVAYVPDNNLSLPKTWRKIQTADTLSFDIKYCEAINSKLTYKAFVRMKELNPDFAACNIEIEEEIKFAPPKFTVTRSSQNCDNSVWRITPNANSLICMPYTITVIDTVTDTPVALDRSEFDDLSAHSITLPLGVHRIEIESDDGCRWSVDTVVTSVPEPDSWKYPNVRYENHLCKSYSMYFDFDYACYPYSWILRAKDNPAIILESKDITDSDRKNRSTSGLEYEKEYEICLLFNNRQDTVRCTKVYQKNRPNPEPYRITFTPEYCLPDTAKGYIRIYRDIDFEHGAVIEFVDGPTTPLHTKYTVPQKDGIRNFYPFSVDSLQAEAVDIEKVRYRFKITDSCDRRDTIVVNYRQNTVKNFGYRRTIGCQKTEITPEGSIYLGDDKIQSYFRIIKVPEGVASIAKVIRGGTGDYFEIDRSGHYVLQISKESGTNSCPFDTIGFDFVKENVSFDADATLTYVCNENDDGYIRVRRKGGVGPFSYELLDNGVSIEKNETGIFHYGRYGESYLIKITDAGCGIEFPATVHMLDLSKTRIINDNTRLCKGEDIKLTCLSIGEYVDYNWTGPNGWSSKERNPVIPNATVEMDSIYTITVLPEGCLKDITQKVDIDVIDPAPLPDTSIYYCLNATAVPLTATPEAGNYLKWYDTDTVYVDTPPVPPTGKLDTLDYFVSQVNSIYGCEGEKSIVRVIIETFPDTVAYAFPDTVCKNAAPVVVIPDTCIYLDYVYRLYNLSNELIGSDTARSNTALEIQSSEHFESSGTIYVEVETKHECVSEWRSKVPVTVVHPAPPAVHDTTYCLDATDAVPLKADSAAGHRLQWYDADRTGVLPSAPVPAVNVAGEFSYWVAQVDTLFGCVGDMAELKVTVLDAPDTVINASADEICRRTSPMVTVGTTYYGYTYTLFNKTGDTLDLKTADGTPLNLNRQDYTLSEKDTLYVEIRNRHKCKSLDRAKVPVSVVVPDVPEVFDTAYCLNAAAEPLKAVPDAGYYIQWYALDDSPANSAPVPPTGKADTLYYNVTQKHDVLHCESDTLQLQVIVETLPDTVAYAFAGDICKNAAPVVIIPDTCIYPDYVYRIYNSSNDLVGSDTARSNTALEIQSDEHLASSGTVYVEVETTHQCVSERRSKVPVTVVHPALPAVYDTFYCIDAKNAVPLRADSTSGNRLQWYSADGTGILLSAPVPATDVAGEFPYRVAQADTLLGCVGDTAELKVVILDAPDTLISASAGEICRRTSPTVTVGKTLDGYTYTLFNKTGDTLDLKIADGTPLNLNRPNYTLPEKDTLYVEIRDRHKCTSRDRAKVPVSVVVPGIPEVFDTLYCLNAAAEPLKAIPDAGYYIQWHALDGSPTNSAPVPPTDNADTLYYNVTQKHNDLYCESDTLQLQVVVEIFHNTVKVISPPICPGRYPVIEIPDSQSDLIYKVYSESGTFLTSKRGSDDSINIVLPYPVEESENYYVESVNAHNCPSEERTETRTEVVNYMYLLPDKIPQFQKGKPYSFQLESNAVAPYEYTTPDMLPLGFSLSVGGLISGTPSWNGTLDPASFRVKVADVNGCYAERIYVFESDIFIPQAFTPNGDGKNDFFMKGRRLVIFDRLGLKIFEGDDGWDGTRYDGTHAPADTYFYLIYYEDENLKTQGRKEGYITLIRTKN